MNNKMIKVNNEVNILLQNALKVAKKYEAIGELDTAEAVLAITSKMVHQRIQTSGLQEALHEFWQDKHALGRAV